MTMSDADREAQARTITCPRCKARVGDPCKSGRNTNPTSHFARTHLAGTLAVPCPTCDEPAGVMCAGRHHAIHHTRVQAAELVGHLQHQR